MRFAQFIITMLKKSVTKHLQLDCKFSFFVAVSIQKKRKCTYLIIHLAVVDLLVGAVSGPMFIDWYMRNNCYLRKTIYFFPLTQQIVWDLDPKE